MVTQSDSGLYYKVTSAYEAFFFFAVLSFSLDKVNRDIITCRHRDRQHCEICLVNYSTSKAGENNWRNLIQSVKAIRQSEPEATNHIFQTCI